MLTAQFCCFCSESLLDSLQKPARTRGKKKKKNSERVIEAKFVLTLSCCSDKLPKEKTMPEFHQKLGEFNYEWPTLQMNLIFRALNQNGADRVEVVIVTASERTCSCFGHLKGEKQRHIIMHTEKTHIKYRKRERWRQIKQRAQH